MLGRMKINLLAVLICSCFLNVSAATYGGTATLLRMSIRNQNSPKTQVLMHVAFGTEVEGENIRDDHENTTQTFVIRTETFGEDGINRVMALLLNALNNNNKIYIDYNDSYQEKAGEILAVYVYR